MRARLRGVLRRITLLSIDSNRIHVLPGPVVASGVLPGPVVGPVVASGVPSVLPGPAVVSGVPSVLPGPVVASGVPSVLPGPVVASATDDSGLEREAIDPIEIGIGPSDIGTGPSDIGTGTGEIGIGTGEIGIGTGEIGTGEIGIGPEIGTGDIGIGPGPGIGPGIGPGEIEIGRLPKKVLIPVKKSQWTWDTGPRSETWNSFVLIPEYMRKVGLRGGWLQHSVAGLHGYLQGIGQTKKVKSAKAMLDQWVAKSVVNIGILTSDAHTGRIQLAYYGNDWSPDKETIGLIRYDDDHWGFFEVPINLSEMSSHLALPERKKVRAVYH